MNNLRLRAMEPEDLDFIYEIENDSKIWNIGVTNVPYSRYILHEYIAKSSADIYTDRQVRLMINDDDKNIGIVDVVNFDPRNRKAEIGIVIAEKFRNSGYGKAALAVAIEYSASVIHLHQLYAIVAEDNTISNRMFRNAGFVGTTTLREWLFDGKKYINATLMQKILEKK